MEKICFSVIQICVFCPPLLVKVVRGRSEDIKRPAYDCSFYNLGIAKVNQL